MTGVLSGLLLWWYARHGMRPIGLVLLGVLLIVCFSQLAIALVNWGVTMLVHPALLPRLDFSKGLPAASRTVVAVPALLTYVDEIDDLLEALEVRFLANRDENLSFALLSDLHDTPQEPSADDDKLVRRAREGIEALNAKYASVQRASEGEVHPEPVEGADPGGDSAGNAVSAPFFLFHRNSRWNAQEGVWMDGSANAASWKSSTPLSAATFMRST